VLSANAALQYVKAELRSISSEYNTIKQHAKSLHLDYFQDLENLKNSIETACLANKSRAKNSKSLFHSTSIQTDLSQTEMASRGSKTEELTNLCHGLRSEIASHKSTQAELHTLLASTTRELGIYIFKIQK
jgi:hypothetical protein